jgi:hypothetical protein
MSFDFFENMPNRNPGNTDKKVCLRQANILRIFSKQLPFQRISVQIRRKF